MAKKKVSKKGVVAGVTAALAAAAAGAYFLYGSKQAKANRENLKGWMLKAKGEVLEKMEKLQSVSESEYKDVVDQVLKRYAKVSAVSNAEINKLARELKAHWNNIERTALKDGKQKRSVSKKTAKKTTKKATRKKAKK